MLSVWPQRPASVCPMIWSVFSTCLRLKWYDYLGRGEGLGSILDLFWVFGRNIFVTLLFMHNLPVSRAYSSFYLFRFSKNAMLFFSRPRTSTGLTGRSGLLRPRFDDSSASDVPLKRIPGFERLVIWIWTISLTSAHHESDLTNFGPWCCELQPDGTSDCRAALM